MSSLRILHAVFSSRIAGSERYCIDLANRQAADGHQVHVAGLWRSPLRSALSPAVTFHGSHLPFFRKNVLRRLARDFEIDICHGHLSTACKALRGMPPVHGTVATLHVGYKAHQHADLDALICVNHRQTNRLEGYAGLIRTIPNWLPSSTAVASTGLRRELGLSSDVFLIGAVGRLHRSKGMDVLIKAFRLAAPHCARLVILGEGKQRAELERLGKTDPRIHILGYREDVRACLQEMDLFVSPSREESFGLAILQAMESGAPIITTATEGPMEFLRDQPVTFVPPDSVSELAGAVSRAHGCFVTGALRRIRYDLSAFDPGARIASITKLYMDTLERRRAPATGSKRVLAAAA
jgi:glycosyltransferase involved in cell wall biosynthesis